MDTLINIIIMVIGVVVLYYLIFFIFLIVKSFKNIINEDQSNPKTIRQMVKKRKKCLIDKIQYSCIKFTTIYYIYCRTPFGIVSEKYYREGHPEKMNEYDVIFKIPKRNLTIKFCAQIRANMVEVFENEKLILAFVDQTLQYPSLFKGPTDIDCKCSAKKLKNIIEGLDEIHLSFAGNLN